MDTWILLFERILRIKDFSIGLTKHVPHLKSMGSAPLWVVILVSWSIALVEYCFAVSANRMGSKTMSLEQLKITQEAIALIAFVPFSIVVMKQPVSWNYAAAAVCIFGAVYFIFRG